MENEIKFDENRRKLIRAFRAKVYNAQPASRETLLAYAFMRGRKYIELESKINEDHPSFGIGRDTFLTNLAYMISREILGVDGSDQTEYVIAKEVQLLIHKWIMEKYEPIEKTEEKAA